MNARRFSGERLRTPIGERSGTLLRTSIGVVSCALVVAFGCRARGGPSEATTSRDADAASLIEADTEVACSRTQSAGAWTQLVFRSSTWRALAERADRRDADAWREIGDLIERNREHVERTTCTAQILENGLLSLGGG